MNADLVPSLLPGISAAFRTREGLEDFLAEARDGMPAGEGGGRRTDEC